ncbi:MAG: hypothetical protein JWM19_132, partial [Actinomycetia bacterium]|nr:hypothetical protein [Actinomycetes bacterium]
RAARPGAPGVRPLRADPPRHPARARLRQHPQMLVSASPLDRGGFLSSTQSRTWRDAAYRLLADARENLPAIIQSSERSLQPLFIRQVREVGRGRKKTTVQEKEPTVGWGLREWGVLGDYLLHDGRLLRAAKDGNETVGDPLPDDAFLRTLAQRGVGHQPDNLPVLWVFDRLFAAAGLPKPNVPAAPEYYGQGYTHLTESDWCSLQRQEIGFGRWDQRMSGDRI